MAFKVNVKRDYVQSQVFKRLSVDNLSRYWQKMSLRELATSKEWSTLAIGLQEFDKNSITEVALSRSPGEVVSRRPPRTWLVCPGGRCPSRPGFICHWHEVSPGEQAGRAGAVDRAEGISRPSVEPSVGSLPAGLDHRSVGGRMAVLACQLRRSVDSCTLGRWWALLKSLRFDSFVSWFVDSPHRILAVSQP